MKRLEIEYTLGAMDSLVSLARYNFVNRVIGDKNKKVLDFGCGSGYGTVVLKEHFNDVTSYDEFPDGYLPKSIRVEQDLSKLSKAAFDVLTCFEVIEHMDQDAQTKLMDNLTSFLKKDGTLFISTVRKMDPPPTENRKKEHVRELTYKELYDFCAERFSNVYTFGQIDQVISTFYPENHYHFVFICSGVKNA